MKRNFWTLLGGAALACCPVTAPLMAQDTAPKPALAEETSNEIIVEGYTEKQVRNFLWRALIETGNTIAKRTSPICVGIDNASVELSQPLKARIEANLAALNIDVGKRVCKVNSIVVFDKDAHRFVNWLGKQNAGLAFDALYLPEKRRLIKPVRPVYNWHVVACEPCGQSFGTLQPQNRLGAAGVNEFQGAEFGPGGRVLASITPADSQMTFSVVDFDAIDGITIEQLGDYLTMQMLVEFRPDIKGSVPADSILNLFTETGSDPDSAPELSALDRTILTEMYGRSRSFNPGAIRASIARQSIGRLEEQGQLVDVDRP